MSKRLIKICIALLVLATLVCTQIISAFAMPAPLYRGDVDVDGKITIDDVTIIQKYCAGLIGSINPPDGIIAGVDIVNFYSDYNSGKAPVGTPITFYTEAYGGIQPFTYEYYVNGDIASDRTEANSFTYTFNETGFYDITVRVYNTFDEYDDYTQSFEVVEEYSSEYPVICSIHLNRLTLQTGDIGIILTANAIFGTEPYEYSFSLNNGAYVQEFSENNSFDLKPYLLEIHGDDASSSYLEVGTHTVEISVKDSSGKTTTENFDFEIIENINA